MEGTRGGRSRKAIRSRDSIRVDRTGGEGDTSGVGAWVGTHSRQSICIKNPTAVDMGATGLGSGMSVSADSSSGLVMGSGSGSSVGSFSMSMVGMTRGWMDSGSGSVASVDEDINNG